MQKESVIYKKTSNNILRPVLLDAELFIQNNQKNAWISQMTVFKSLYKTACFCDE